MRLHPIVLQQIALVAAALTSTLACGSRAESAAPATSTGAFPPGREILTKAAETYRQVQRYTFGGELRTGMSLEGQRQDVKVVMSGAFERPRRYRLLLTSPAGSTLFVSDGDTVSTYTSQLGQYAKAPWQAPSADAARSLPGFHPAGGHALSGYERLDQHVKRADVARLDTLTVSGRDRAAWVLDVTYDPAFTGEDSLTRVRAKTFWIDTERSLVLRDVVKIERGSPSGGPQLAMEQTSEYTELAWEPELADTVFKFRAPAGAQAVDRLGAASPAADDRKGQSAADFSLKDLEGKPTKLSGKKGQVVLLNFWATWCGPCRRELPEIQKLHDQYGARGLTVLGVNCSETASQARSYVKKNRYTFPILLDAEGAVQKQYGVEGIPTVFILDREGKIAAHYVGAQTGATLRAGLKLAGIE